jgi:hypothetical protein
MDRRTFLRLAAAGATLPVLGGVLAACGGDDSATTSAGSTAAPGTSTGSSGGASTTSGPPKKVKIGFIALTDCSSIVMAQELGYFAGGIGPASKRRHGCVRRVVSGDIDAACLYSCRSLRDDRRHADHPLPRDVLNATARRSRSARRTSPAWLRRPGRLKSARGEVEAGDDVSAARTTWALHVAAAKYGEARPDHRSATDGREHAPAR